jgi:hypothetical protein
MIHIHSCLRFSLICKAKQHICVRNRDMPIKQQRLFSCERKLKSANKKIISTLFAILKQFSHTPSLFPSLCRSAQIQQSQSEHLVGSVAIKKSRMKKLRNTSPSHKHSKVHNPKLTLLQPQPQPQPQPKLHLLFFNALTYQV